MMITIHMRLARGGNEREETIRSRNEAMGELRRVRSENLSHPQVTLSRTPRRSVLIRARVKVKAKNWL